MKKFQKGSFTSYPHKKQKKTWKMLIFFEVIHVIHIKKGGFSGLVSV
jgi:hypothetical protein